MVEALEHDGYVANGPDGWSATAMGCELLERQRASALLGSRNQPQPPPL
jgi:hypothetical protein